jgi:zinc carboxypeptidase
MPRPSCLKFALLICAALAAATTLFADGETQPVRDPKQSIDEAYTAKIRKYTTEPYFSSPLVDYLPASKSVPTPEVVLGDVAGAPGILPYAEEVSRYMRLLEKATPRVKVFSIGTTEEGREMIAVAISSEANLKNLEQNHQRLAKLADPRLIQLNDAEADKLVAESVPVYYITGTIHSTETGAPTALMELAYRLAVDESPYIREIREGVITLITPVVEVDGRDRMVDIYRWHLSHPKDFYPPLIYWGKYVGHDNNRDAMAVKLKLTENVLNTYVGWDAQVLHDLHESVPYLYDNTVGDGPYNAWVDPILVDEWQMIGSRNVADLTKFGMPGVFTHGDFDTWSPGYLMFIAAMHNGISRLYETFGNDGADTRERTLEPDEYSRTWYRANPPLPKAMWSQRNNNNYEETGLLTSLHYFNENKRLFLRNFYLKSKRSVQKPSTEGPSAYVLPADDPRSTVQADLLHVMFKQHVEISRATAAFTVTLPVKKEKKPPKPGDSEEKPKPAAPTRRSFPAGSYVIRMDQPYSRVADALLDYQYWSPDDPQKTPYDDTAWTLGELFGVQVARVTDPNILAVPMQRVTELPSVGGVQGEGALYAIDNHAEPALATLRYRLKNVTIDAAEEPFQSGDHKFSRGTFLIRISNRSDLDAATKALGLKAVVLTSAPSVKTHPVRAPRVAYVHTWISTQEEGWWRLALDELQIPYDYMSTQALARIPDLNANYDVILFPPVGWNSGTTRIVDGLPTSWGNPLPWLNTPETPNLGKNDSTPDMRPGLGWDGVAKLQSFLAKGGVLLTATDTSQFALSLSMANGVTASNSEKMKIVGAIVGTRLVDAGSPIAYGYDEKVSAYCDNGPIFSVNSMLGSHRRHLGPEASSRPTGRGTKDDPDYVVGRAASEIPDEPEREQWEVPIPTDEQLDNNPRVIPPADRARVILRYADSKDLLISGLVEGGNDIAQHPAVLDVPSGAGHVILFSINPIYRGETENTYSLVLNTLMNFDSLNAGRKDAEK